MSKQQFDIKDFGHVNDALVARIESVIADRKSGRLSSSAIYKAHNELFKLREPIQTCQSCLVIRGDKLGKWYEWYAKQAAPQTPQVQIPVPNVGTGNEPDANAPQATHDLEDGRVLTVLADGTVKIGEEVVTEGAFVRADGVALAIFEGQLISNPEGGDEDKAVEIALEGGSVMLVHEDGSVSVDGAPATHDCIYFLASGGSIVIDADGFVAPEAKDYAGVVDKYALVIGDTKEGEIATLTTTVEESAPRMTANELAFVKARLDELNAAPQIILQKVDGKTYASQGDPFYGIFTPSAEDATKGQVVVAETGKAVAAGTYATEDVKQVLSVQPGGKASYKAV